MKVLSKIRAEYGTVLFGKSSIDSEAGNFITGNARPGTMAVTDTF